nr:hypothetical protein BAR15_10057 [Bartonella sp. AR 15-3]
MMSYFHKKYLLDIFRMAMRCKTEQRKLKTDSILYNFIMQFMIFIRIGRRVYYSTYFML